MKALLIILLVVLCSEISMAQMNRSRIMKVDYRSLVSRADLSYDTPVTRSEEGMPVGNGQMGSLVWTTPSAIHFQINRVDVFSVGCNTNSFPIAHTTYANGCGYLDINVVDYGDDVFTGNAFNQHLSVYDGLSTVKGNGLSGRVLVWNDGDVIATEISDQRNSPSAIDVDLRMLRYVMSYKGNKDLDVMNKHEVQVQTGELSAMYAMLPIAIRASEILGVDAELRPVWKEILDHLAPIPATQLPAEFYDLCTIASENKELFNRVLGDYKKRNPNGANENTNVSLLSRNAVVASNLGLADQVKYLIPNQMRVNQAQSTQVRGVFRNRLALGEGPGAIECERLGLASQALNAALLQSVPPSPGKDPINYIFPAWPKEWDAQFTLAARDAFLVSASITKGQIEFVEIYSQKGGKCVVQNPWGESELTQYNNGKKVRNVSGKLLVINTIKGDVIAIMPKGKPLMEKIKN